MFFDAFSLCHCVTVSRVLCHCVWLCHCAVFDRRSCSVSLCHCVTVSLCHCVTVSRVLCHCVSLGRCALFDRRSCSVSLCHCVAVSLCHCVACSVSLCVCVLPTTYHLLPTTYYHTVQKRSRPKGVQFRGRKLWEPPVPDFAVAWSLGVRFAVASCGNLPFLTSRSLGRSEFGVRGRSAFGVQCRGRKLWEPPVPDFAVAWSLGVRCERSLGVRRSVSRSQAVGTSRP